MNQIHIFLFAIIVGIASACSQDYECGNVPYKYCSGGLNDCSETLFGIAVSSQYVYYAQTCRTLTTEPNITFKRVSTLGSSPVNLYTQAVVPAPGNPERILGIVGDTLFYAIALRQPGPGLRSLNVVTGVVSNIYPVSSFPQPYFDYDTNTYFCSYRPSLNGVYTIDRHNGIVTSGDLSDDATLYVLPQGYACAPLKRYGANDIIFTDTITTFVPPSSFNITTNFFRGSINCVNCTLPTPFYTTHSQVIDIAVSGTDVYFTTTSGLYKIGSGSANTSVTSGEVDGVKVMGNSIYYTSGVNVERVNIDGTNNVQLNAAPNGSCVCRPVFTGNDCQTCNGQAQWDYNGQPNCVPTNQYGTPETCNQDYQCGNAPYTVCYGTCQCRPNFTGPRCDVCPAPYQVTWSSYGYPSCA